MFVSAVSAEALVQGQAYIISSINVDPSELITANQKYSLVPQVVVYDGTTEYVGSVTKFTGCHNGKLYDESVQVGNCFLGGLATTDSDGLMSKEDKAKLDGITVDKLITSDNIGSQTVERSNSSFKSERLLINGATTEGIFNWSGQGGQPTWLWGSNDGTNMYVWNPSNFSVNYANSAGYANRVWTQSHNGSWYINSNWNGTYFVTNARENGGGELPISVGNADTVDGYHAGDIGKFYGIGGLLVAQHLSTNGWNVSEALDYTTGVNAWAVCSRSIDQYTDKYGVRMYINGTFIVDGGESKGAWSLMVPLKAGDRVQAHLYGNWASGNCYVYAAR